jgi:hypothetical protein
MRRVISEENDSPKSFLQFAETYLVVINHRITLRFQLGPEIAIFGWSDDE